MKLFPEDERLQYPIYTGLLQFFPHACAAVARHSLESNAQHIPGKPLYWDPEKSIGTGDQLLRHLMEGDYVSTAWRAMELLERNLTGGSPDG